VSGPLLYLGLDDTDSLERGGTGQLARSLAERLVAAIPGIEIEGVSRHQLLQDPRVPATRRNRCSCVVVRSAQGRIEDVVAFARDHIRDGSVAGSDPGLCVVVDEAGVGLELVAFGRRAQRELVDQAAARRAAAGTDARAESLGGTGDGVIGAVAAVGLRRTEDDGWLTLWRGIRSLEGTLTVAQLLTEGLDGVEDEQGHRLAADQPVETGGHVRPALRKGRRILVVRPWGPGRWESLKAGGGGG
jgi:hypothetical protein